MSPLQRLSPFVASIALLALFPQTASAQVPGSISGQVVYSGGPVVPGVQVLFPELGLRADTDAEGRFDLAAVRPGEHRLTIYALGCELATRTVEVEPGEATEVAVQVGPRAFALDELVVTGTPAERSRAELPFSVEELSGNRLRTATAAGSVANLLRGMAGGRVIRGNGLPGQESDILLRGPATLGGAEQQPLVVVDGIIAGHSTAGIDPMDVERIEVLKGAAAAAHYGSRAQGGVIEITTKRRPPGPGPGGSAAAAGRRRTCFGRGTGGHRYPRHRGHPRAPGACGYLWWPVRARDGGDHSRDHRPGLQEHSAMPRRPAAADRPRSGPSFA